MRLESERTQGGGVVGLLWVGSQMLWGGIWRRKRPRQLINLSISCGSGTGTCT